MSSKRFAISTFLVCLVCFLTTAVTSLEAAEEPAKETDSKRPYAEEAIAHYNKAVRYHQIGELENAESEYKSALSIDSRLEEASCNLGGIYVAQKKYKDAADILNKASDFRPQNIVALNLYGSALVGLKRYDEAIAQYKKVLALEPSNKNAAENLLHAMKLRGHVNPDPLQ